MAAQRQVEPVTWPPISGTIAAMGTHRLVALAFPFLFGAPVMAQVYGNGAHGALAPVTDVTLDTTANGGVFQFTSITIPAGVTVHLTGSNPATLL